MSAENTTSDHDDSDNGNDVTQQQQAAHHDCEVFYSSVTRKDKKTGDDVSHASAVVLNHIGGSQSIEMYAEFIERPLTDVEMVFGYKLVDFLIQQACQGNSVKLGPVSFKPQVNGKLEKADDGTYQPTADESLEFNIIAHVDLMEKAQNLKFRFVQTNMPVLKAYINHSRNGSDEYSPNAMSAIEMENGSYNSNDVEQGLFWKLAGQPDSAFVRIESVLPVSTSKNLYFQIPEGTEGSIEFVLRTKLLTSRRELKQSEPLIVEMAQ